MPPVPQKAAESKTIGRYLLKEIIGRGGMGLVYKAHDPIVRRDVALKTIRGSPDRMALELFRKECSVLASLSHPNIIEIFDIGEFEEEGESKPYFVMPLLPGATLSDLIRDAGQRLTVERAVEIILQTCRGLNSAHENGVVHRDLKPSNIFVMQDDSVKIIDFGMVHMVDTQTSMTIKGGTLPYMAPEQVQMQPASALSDIFSLGVVLYETLTRRRPFEGNSENEVVQAILYRIPPPASDLNPAVSHLVSRVVHKAMAKQPWYRFSTAREFSETLQKALRNEPIEIFDAIRIQPRVQRATKATEQGDYQFAGEILSELEAEGHLDPAIPFLRSQIEKGKRQKTIAQLLDSARTRVEEEEYLLALQKIQEVLQLDANNTAALSLRNTIENRRSEQKIDEWFRLARQHLDNHAFGHARSAMQNILQIAPKDTRAQQMMAEVDRREHEYLRIRAEKAQLYQSAVDAWQGGDVSVALTKLERLVELDRKAPDTSTPERGVSMQSFYNQVRSEHDALRSAYEEARKNLVDRNFMMALAICDQYLTKYPGHALFQALKFDVDERQRQEWSARIAEIDRSVEAEPDLERRVNILKEALDLHPGEAHFERTLRLMRDKRDLVQSIVNKARNFEAGSQFHDALGQWEILQSVYHQYPGLEFEIERVKRRRDQQARTEAKSRWIEQVDRLLEAGDHARALELLRDALAEFPEDAELSDLAKLAHQENGRKKQARELLAQGQDLCAERSYEEGIAKLRSAFLLDERNQAFRARVLEIILEHARVALESDWNSGEFVIQQVLALDPGNSLANSLRILALDRRREESVTQCVRQARQLQTAGDIQGALTQVEQGLSLYPDEPRLVQLFATLQKVLQESRRKRDEFVNHCLYRIEEFQAARDNENAISLLRQGLAAYPDEPRLTQALASLETAVEEAQRQQREGVRLCVSQADKLRDAGDLAGALAEIERGLASYPQDSRLREPQTALKEALQKSREEFINTCVAETRKLEKTGDLPGAVRRVEQALAAYPAEAVLQGLAASLQASLQELQRKVDQSVGLHLALARERQQAGNLQEALAHIEQGLASHPGDPRLLQFSATLNKAIGDSQHQRDEFVAWCLAEARKLQDAGNLASALAQVEQGLSSYPQDAALREIEARLRDALEASLRKQAEDVEVCLAQARDLEAGGHLEDALSRVEQALSLYPGERSLTQLQVRLQGAAQEARRKTDVLVSQVRQLQAAGGLEDALRCAERDLASYPHEPRLLQLCKTLKSEIQERGRAQEESISWCIHQVRKLREVGDLQGASAEIEQGLASYPHDAKLKELELVVIKEIEESRCKKDELISFCTAQARKYQEAGDLRVALAKIEEVLAVYPGEQRLLPIAAGLRKTLQDVQRKRDESINLFTARARELQEAGNLQAALAEVERGLASHPDDDRLAQLRSIVKKTLDESLLRNEESIARFLMQAGVLQHAGNLKGALAHVEQGRASHPDDSRLRQMELALHEAVEELRRKRNEIVLGCMAKAREFETAGDLERAIACVREGLSACPDEPRLIEAAASLRRERGDELRKRETFITACLADARKLQASGDLQGGIDHVQQGLASYPDDHRLRQLRDALQTAFEESLHRREEFVSRCIREIRELHSSGDLKSALGQIDQALSFYPGEPELVELHAVLVKAHEEYRRKLDDLVMQCLMRARQLEAKGDLKSALGEIERCLSTYPAEPRLVQACTALHARLRRVWYRRPVVYVPAALVVMIAALVVAFHPRPPQRITLEIKSQKLTFPTYRIGSPDSPAPLPISLSNPDIPFKAIPDVPWIVVTTKKGERHNQQWVGINPDELKPGPHFGTIKIRPATDAGVGGNLVVNVSIDVSIDVKPRAEPPPPQPTPAPKNSEPALDVDRRTLYFEYQMKDQPPKHQQIRVRKGSISTHKPSEDWLRASCLKTGCDVWVEPGTLPARAYAAKLVLGGSDGEGVSISVTLKINHASQETAFKLNDLQPPKRKSSANYNEIPESDWVWTGTLAMDEELHLDATGSWELAPPRAGRGVITGRSIPFVELRALDITPGGIKVDLQDGEIVIRNNGPVAVHRITIHWIVKQ
jgi:serine/threonine protein kinase